MIIRGGTVAFDLNNGYQGECYNCGPYRPFTSGEVVVEVLSGAATPEPAIWLLAAPVVARGPRRRRR